MIRIAAMLCVCALLTSGAQAQESKLTLGALLSDGMVLQHGTPVRVYGKAKPGNKVVAAIQGQSATATVDGKGNWTATLPALKPGGPFTLTATSGGETVMVGDVLVGEVWICSGQSNMEWSLAASKDGPAEAAQANDNGLRMFIVPKNMQVTPKDALAPGQFIQGKWLAATPANAPAFSGVGYFFAKELRKSRNVPIGMIFTAWGGTRIQAWMRRDPLAKAGGPAGDFVPLDMDSPQNRERKARMEARTARWKAAGVLTVPTALPSRVALSWASPTTDAGTWPTMKLPQAWEASGIEEFEDLDGIVWFRRDVTIPAELAGKSMTLTLGAIDDTDITYFNGVEIGKTGTDVPNNWETPRKYTVPGNLVKAGKNVVSVRVTDTGGGGGLTGPATALALSNGQTSIDLAGDWRYKIESVVPGAGNPSGLNPNIATVLYNGMIAPFTNYTVKGAIWYQGESNAGEPTRYATLMPAMIQNWRDDFQNPQMYFYMVQLAPFGSGNSVGTWYAETREAQFHSTKVLKNVGMAVITDVGNETDIHPTDKKTVGERLALLARKNAYKEKVLAEAPEPSAFVLAPGKVTVKFLNVGDGLKATGEMVNGFTVKIGDTFVRATARIVGKDTVEVIPVTRSLIAPTAVRFGFANYDGTLNLSSSAGIPATPFRSDVPAWFGKR